jgi:outer membrane immunogenic protein
MKHLIFSVATGTVAGLILGHAALAADMPLKAPMMAPPPASWTGFYIGVNVGVDWSHNTGTWPPLPTPAAFGVFGQTGQTSDSGPSGGFQVGYNWQFASAWVAGIEGDMTWTGAKGQFGNTWLTTAGAPVVGSQTAMGTSVEWLATVRARLGFLLLPNLMLFGTGGGAWGDINYTASSNNGVVSGPGVYSVASNFSTVSSGWVAGAGLEWMMSNNWLLRWEYLHYDLRSAQATVANSVNFPAFPSGFAWSSTHIDSMRGAISYKF